MIITLEVKGVTKKFVDTVAVDNLSFSVKSGEVLGIIGQNGAGKSTTFKMILNLLKPDHGTITFDGQQLDEKILDHIGFLPEERGLYLDMKVKEQVLYFASLHGFSTQQAAKDLPSWLNKLAVKGNENSLIKNLSKGNQQKIQLITTLIHRPKLVILDEPFSGLDPVNTNLLINVIKELKQAGTAIIFSSHNMKNVSEVSDQLLMIVNGQQKLYGSINEIKGHFEKQKVYLEGVFSDLPPEKLAGVVQIENDYPGKIITFASENEARLAIDHAKQYSSLQGYRLLPPSLDDIFQQIINEEVKDHE
ncbi:MAG: ATP-binding cassette domain-containing protein [Ligilactobacillus agilis]|nr:ATP-binding cassette domain-containing protein [Ligilactobacillus agilis]